MSLETLLEAAKYLEGTGSDIKNALGLVSTPRPQINAGTAAVHQKTGE